MPNICGNWVQITGPTETLEKLLTIPFEPRRWIPVPENAGIDWCSEHWGTKWICNPSRDNTHVMLQRVEGKENTLEARFESAWAPPIAFYRTIVREYLSDVTLEYEYHEWMMGFVGYGRIVAGEEDTDPDHYNYTSKRDMREIHALRTWHVAVWNPHFTEELEEDNDDETSSLEEGWDDIRNYPEYTGESAEPVVRVPTPMPVFENLIEADTVPVPPKKIRKHA